MHSPLSRPDLAPYRGIFQPSAPEPAPAGSVRGVFLGTSTVLLDDGATAILTDGFFSRPGLLRVGTARIGPDHAAIDRSLQRLGLGRRSCAAVLCCHSHYDHAMDAPAVALKTGADVVGSESTANIARGGGLPAERIRVLAGDSALRYGAFTVTAAHSVHSAGDRFPGTVEAPLTPPARAGAWRTGACYSFFIGHPAGTVLVHGSAEFVPGALQGRSADAAYLGITGLSRRSARFREEYWAETVGATGVRRLLPVHWDDFFRPLDRPPRALPHAVDDLGATLDFLADRAARDGVDLQLPVFWRRTDPFA